MSITLHHVIIHELVKEQHKPLQASNLRTETLPVDDPIVIKLVNGVAGIYGKKANSAQYGRFSETGKSEFPAIYKAYYELTSPKEEDFITLSQDTVTELENRLEGSSPSSGGYVLFADYDSGFGRTLLIAMLKNRPGLRLSNSLKPEELEHIDLNSLHQAARVSSSKFKEHFEAEPEDKANLNYLSFVSPSGTQTTAGYFISALGCTKGTASAAATKAVLKEVPQFFRDTPGLDKADARKVKQDIVCYLQECVEKQRSALLSNVDAIARKYFPTDEEGLADELSERLFARLNGEQNGVSVEFSVNKNEVGKALYYKYKSSNWNFEFKKSCVGVSADAEIEYDKINNMLTIHHLPDSLREAIENDLRERNIIP